MRKCSIPYLLNSYQRIRGWSIAKTSTKSSVLASAKFRAIDAEDDRQERKNNTQSQHTPQDMIETEQ